MNFIFFLMSPFFFLMGSCFFMLSLFFSSLNFSMFFSWNLYLLDFSVDFPIYLDFISCFFIAMVLIISSCILIYSEYYMHLDLFKSRFFYLMFLFVMSMVFLVLSPSIFAMLLGWDGLGLVSYCLVVYYQSFSSYSSGFITALTNRLGDVLILSSLGMSFCYGSWMYMSFLKMENMYFSLFFFLASLTKSAQIPFSSWLPAAMAAPTPVSSLVHSSTLVTAGVYILIRFSFLLNKSLKSFLMFCSLLTMVMAGLSAIYEYDLKKIIALSTLSQLGFMMSSISLGFLDLAFFHLVTHAGFKALMFMCAGIYIHTFLDNQDIRGYGIFSLDLFITTSMFNVANLSLCGFPFLSGFFSKDLILEMMFMKSEINLWHFFFFCFGTFLTVLYSFRLFFLLSFKPCSFPFSFSIFMKKISFNFSMYILFFLSITLGFVGSNFFFLPLNYIILPFQLKLLIFLTCLFSFFFSWSCYFILKYQFNFFLDFLYNMWFLYFLKTDFLTKSFWSKSSKLNFVTTGFLEMFLGHNLVSVINLVSLNMSSSSKIFFFMFFSFFFILNCVVFFFLI
nr:NADH dehydrogenase subunit 5 [Neohydatothrips samayunkur]